MESYKFCKNSKLDLPLPVVEDNSKILIFGNTEGICGYFSDIEDPFSDTTCFMRWTWLSSIVCNSTVNITVIGPSNVDEYWQRAISDIINSRNFKNKNRYNIEKRYKRHIIKNNNDYFNILKNYESTNMKFDICLMNPPYDGDLHLSFLKMGCNVLSDTGKMVIVEPATWLINIRKNGKAKTYDEIKEKINGHIESVMIENLNKEFNTGLYVPFAITTIDMSKAFDTIDYTCCGEHKIVKSVYDCNLVGEYSTIWAILEKVRIFGDMMKTHITKENMGDGMFYTKYAEIVSGAMANHNIDNSIAYTWDSLFDITKNGEFYNAMLNVSLLGDRVNEVFETLPKSRQRGGGKSKVIRYSDKNADCIYGTKEELENWKHFIFNNKLPLFINIVLTIDQHNNSKEFLPWLVDKQYTDDEINKLFKFTDEEIKLIETTIKKYERNSPWFKRFMCGKDTVTDDEVQKFIDNINA